jgi:hypothetical protein
MLPTKATARIKRGHSRVGRWEGVNAMVCTPMSLKRCARWRKRNVKSLLHCLRLICDVKLCERAACQDDARFGFESMRMDSLTRDVCGTPNRMRMLGFEQARRVRFTCDARENSTSPIDNAISTGYNALIVWQTCPVGLSRGSRPGEPEKSLAPRVNRRR